VNPKYFKLINTFLVVVPMTLIMAVVGVIRTYGLGEGWLYKVINAYLVMMPVAYLSAFLIIPWARKLSEKLISKP
jgi:hypothetical protein